MGARLDKLELSGSCWQIIVWIRGFVTDTFDLALIRPFIYYGKKSQ